jgi:2-methylcitrate dehydratase PrpD
MSDGSMSKRLHVGRAAEAGLNSAVLARAGFTGPSDIFSAPWGSFLSLYGGNAADEAELYAGLGDKWLVERASIKPYASCRSTHSAIDALLRLKQQQGLAPEDIQCITVHSRSLISDMCGGRDTSSLVAAQLSMPFALATAMLRDRVSLHDIALKGRTHPEVLSLMERIHLEVDNSQQGGSAEPHLEILAAGKVYRCQATLARGAMDNRLSDDETVAKFSELAGTRLHANSVEKLARQIMALEACPDIRQIHNLVVTTEEPLPIR